MSLEAVSGKIVAVPPGTWPECFKVVSFAAMREWDEKKYTEALINYGVFLSVLNNPVLDYPSKRNPNGTWKEFQFPPREALRGAADVLLTRNALYVAVPSLSTAQSDAISNWLGGEGGQTTWNDNWFTALAKNVSPLVSYMGNVLSEQYLDPDQFIKSVQPSNVQLGPTLLKLRAASPFVHHWVVNRAFGKALGKAITQKAGVEQQQSKIVLDAALHAEKLGKSAVEVVGNAANAANAALKSAGDALGYASWIARNIVPIAIFGGLAYALFFTPQGLALVSRARAVGKK